MKRMHVLLFLMVMINFPAFGKPLKLINENDSCFVKKQNILEGKVVKYYNGTKVILCSNNGLDVGIGIDGNKINKHQKIYIIVFNHVDKSILVDPSNIHVAYVKYGERHDCEIYSCDEYVRKVRRNILWFGPSNTGTIYTTGTSNSYDSYGNSTTTRTSVATNVYTGANNEASDDAEFDIRGHSPVLLTRKLFLHYDLENKTLYPTKYIRALTTL